MLGSPWPQPILRPSTTDRHRKFEGFPMANTPQAKKRIRRNDRRADVNKSRVSRIRTFVKKVESAITAGNKDEAAEALKAAQPEMMRGASKGVLHKNTVARSEEHTSEIQSLMR